MIGCGFYAAIAEASKAQFKFKNGGTFALGAVAMKDGKIIARGCNYKIYNEKFSQYGYETIHAEALCLSRCKQKADTLMVIRVTKNGTLSMSVPCSRCFNLCKLHGIKRIYYSDWSGNIQRMKI